MDNYQLNYEDIIHAELVAQQPGRTAYIDECGGFGFEFNKPDVSAYYVVCAVIVDNEKILAIENKIEEIKKLCFGGGEMKSSSISANHARRAKVLTELLMLDIQLIVLIANKKEFIEGSPLTEFKRTFKKFLNQRLFDTMYRAYPKLKIVEDEYGTDEFQESYKNYIRNNRPRPNLFNEYDFDYVDSRKSNIVQVADIIIMNIKRDVLRAEFIEYVSKLTRHIRIDYLRCLKYRHEFEIPKEDLYDDEQDEEPAIDDTLIVDDAVQLNWVLSGLTSEEQRIVRLCVIEEKPVSEVATVLGKSERWIRTEKKRALFKLKNSVLEGEQGERRTRF